MSGVEDLVRRFYDEIWNNQDFRVAEELLDERLSFRGSLGPTLHHRSDFLDYVGSVTQALSGYHCQVDELLSEGARAAAKMTFSGVHVGNFLGYAPTHKGVQWHGAAFFREKGGRLVDIWVLGDLHALTQLLEEQARAE